MAKFLGGMPRQRQIPEFAPATFQSWFKKRPAQEAISKADVMLWPDTFNNYFFPDTAQAATEVLESAGFRVRVPAGHALHLAQVIQMAQSNGLSRESKLHPETAIVRGRNATRRKARTRALLVLAGVALGGMLLRKLMNQR